MDPLDLVAELHREHSLSLEQWHDLVSCRTPEAALDLTRRARAVRNERYGKRVFMRGLVEFSNYCKNDCFYCGIRKGNKAVQRYRLTPEEIMDCCEDGYALGFRTFVLQGGEDPWFTDERMVPLVAGIHERFPDCAITLSLGERSTESYRRLREAGATRYLLRHETADECHYRKLHPQGMELSNRKKCLFALRDEGYQVGSGFMVGSPGQDAWCLARDMVFLQELRPHMIGIGPFVPHRDTPFGAQPAGSVELTLFMLSALRLAHPDALLPATTALGTVADDGRERGILAGANVVMPNLSPRLHRADYALYDNKIATGEEAVEGLALLRVRIGSIGYELVSARGDSLVPVASRGSVEEKGMIG